MFIEMKEGRIFANTGGMEFDPARATAILIHGSGCDHTVWGGQNRYLAHHGVNVLALDLPGHGRSLGVVMDSIGGLADFVIRLIETVGVTKPILIGHSMGALIALEAARRLGDRCAGMALCGAASAMPVHPALLEAAQNNKLRAAEFISSWGHGNRAHRGGNPAHGVWMLRQGVALMERMAPGGLYTNLKACADYQDVMAAAAEVTCPSLLLLGKGDKMTPVKAAQPLMQTLADVETVILPDAGHMMMIEAPRESCTALMSLVHRVAGHG